MSKLFGTKITSKGTELPLIDLKGKPYLQVAHRLVWFREDYPEGAIYTEMVEKGEGYAVFKAQVTFGGQIIAIAHKAESQDNFPDYIEKAETGAVGRALGMAGYGTQYEPEFDEKERLADAPVVVAKKKETKKAEYVVANAKPEQLIKEINEAAYVLEAKKVLTREGLKDKLKKEYSVESTKDLDSTKLNKFHTEVMALLA